MLSMVLIILIKEILMTLEKNLESSLKQIKNATDRELMMRLLLNVKNNKIMLRRLVEKKLYYISRIPSSVNS